MHDAAFVQLNGIVFEAGYLRVPDDFTVADTDMLNRFLRDCFRQPGQGGTHSQQRNMRHLFTYLQREIGHPHPYTDNLHRYAEQSKRRPATLK